jgi:hypothetical protein
MKLDGQARLDRDREARKARGGVDAERQNRPRDAGERTRGA